MAQPPPSGPSSDIEGVNRDARIGVPNRDAGSGTAADKQQAEEQSLGRPSQTSEKAGGADEGSTAPTNPASAVGDTAGDAGDAGSDTAADRDRAARQN